jgi:L-cysteine S-thiosulfotransferase
VSTDDEMNSRPHCALPANARTLAAVARIVIAASVVIFTMTAAAQPAAPAIDARSGAFRVAADGIPEAIDGAKGDAERGRTLIVAREAANCVLCHAVSDPGVRFSGNLGPPLDGIARKLSVAQLRLRVVDDLRVNPATVMPSYYRVDGLDRVASAYRGKPILDASQVEDIVAYLATLK